MDPEGNRSFVEPTLRWKDSVNGHFRDYGMNYNIKMDFRQLEMRVWAGYNWVRPGSSS